jgi:hypothetical protein
MEGDDAVWLILVASLLVGYAWGRVSSRLGLDRPLSLLFSQPLMGLLSVLVGWCSLLLDFKGTMEHSVYLVTHAPLRVVPEILEFNRTWFLGGALFGLPGLFGWLAGYRRKQVETVPPSAEHSDDVTGSLP